MSPEGVLVEGENLSVWCREMKLSYQGISRTLLGYQKQYRGWHKLNTVLPSSPPPPKTRLDYFLEKYGKTRLEEMLTMLEEIENGKGNNRLSGVV